MTETAATREEVLAAYEAERRRQADQRVMVAEAAWRMRNDNRGSDPCLEGVNGWLQSHQVPAIPGTATPFNETRTREVALGRIPVLQEPEMYTAVGLQRQLTQLQERGAEWTAGLIRDLDDAAEEYSEISPEAVAALGRRLRGEPEPEAAAAGNAESPAAGTAPAAGMTNVAMTVTFVLQMPTRQLNGATQQMITTHAESAVRNAIATVVRNSGYGAQFARQTQITTTVQQG